MNSELSGRRVLLVEDEVMVAWTLEDMLAELGCTVVGPAARVDQALAMIEAEALDAVVLDVNLNGEKSYPVADALVVRGVPFVFSTGYNRNNLHPGYLGFPMLQKPFERSQLGDALTKLLTPGILMTPGQKGSSSVWDTTRLRFATHAAGVALWSWDVDTDEIALDEHAQGLWGVDSGPVTFEALSARIHPEDLDRVRATFAATRKILGPYEVDFRILHGGEVRWVSARGRGDDEGIVGRIMFGVFLDVTGRKLAEEAREMLAAEMGHRIKNLFAIASALTAISARSTMTTTEMAREGPQGVLGHQLQGHLARKGRIEPALDVDPGEFSPLELDVRAQFLPLACEVGLLGVGLRADRDVLACRHRHRTGDQARNAREQDSRCGRPTSLGHNWQLGGRNAPTVLNAVFNTAQFWDGRAADLKEQAGGPIANPVEMGITKEHAVGQLQGIPGYVVAFKAVYPGEADPITYPNIEAAIAVFEATLITPAGPFDRWLAGDPTALDAAQQQGLATFIGKGCATCHNGINVGGGMYAPFGVVQKPGWEFLPPGDRGRFAVTKTVEDDYVFKVPSLRNIELTAPYFHTGHAWDLRQAVAVMGQSQLGEDLTEPEIDQVTAFLRALTGEQPRVEFPLLPPSVATTPRPEP